MRKSFHLLFALLILFAIPTFAQSSLSDYGQANVSGKSIIILPRTPITFLNQTPNQVNGLFADSDCQLCGTLQQSVADNFVSTTVGSQCITELVIWGGYYPEDIPNATDDFTIIIHSDNAGQPGTVVDSRSGLQAASRVQTGVIIFGTHEYTFTFDFSSSPISLPSAGTYWIELFNNSVESGNFYWETGNVDATNGIMGSAWYTTTPATTWNLDGATDLSAQINGDDNCSPCPVGAADNPNPANGSTNVSIDADISWTNGAGTTNIEVFFDGVSVYTGAPITTFNPGTLNYATTYTWKVVCKNDTCGTSGPNWSFTTMQNPMEETDTITVYTQNVQYWTGNTEGTTKTDGEINTVFPNVGWAVFDVSTLPPTVNGITSVHYYGYVNATNWPYWSSTPMGTVNPISDPAANIFNQINANFNQGTAYIYSDEANGFAPGWHDYECVAGVTTDFFNSLTTGRFAMGFVDRDGTATYFLNFDGHTQTNPPYLVVIYTYITPVELTSFTATADFGVVELSWITATETNNQGFEVQRSNGNDFETIAFVEGHGTTTQTQAYSYQDNTVEVGSYNYRLKQIDFDGTFEYSSVIDANVPAPAEFALDQNYPNPFNPSTKIAFRLAVDSKVSLKIFDILGQEVATLVNTNLVAGAHSVTFDASALNSGVYLYRIEATGNDGSNFVDVKKMILTK